MGLGSFINWLQAVIARRTLRGGPFIQYFGFAPIWAGDFIFGFLNKFDIATSSASSRIDRIVLQARSKSEQCAVPNEQKLAIVTGANSGIGYETAKAIGRAGYYTILACRNPEAGMEAVERLERQTGLTDRFKFMELDLASIESVDKFVHDIKAREGPVDLLVNNAGLMGCPFSKTKDGVELQFGTNHVGHFVLTTGLLEKLKQAKDGARIVVLSSIAAFLQSDIDYERVELKPRYHEWKSYGISKLANLLFATALARKLEGTGVMVNAAHPGTVATGLMRFVCVSSVFTMLQNIVLDSPQVGSLTSIYLALSPEVESVTGKMYARGIEREMHPSGNDIAKQDNLWEYTENLVASIRKTKKQFYC
ncbi:hypothetical protein H4R20_002767 [Coemansia guatemalensis]|uniref:Uncharacterized protein n=1 Tax=Coemansia guatemalensis TaxID=2761395 RepID=A0A9W8LT98_9FUNG|nr:hypothetical protein H4R20_002767 [Coemansia guatemalensis]